jgi:hypothetical protein
LEKRIIPPGKGESLERFQGISSGIEDLRERLRKYLQQERIPLLKRRIERAEQVINREVDKVLEWFDQNYSEEELNSAKNRLILQLGRNFERALIRALRGAKSDQKKENKKLLEEKLKERIKNQNILEPLEINSQFTNWAFQQIEGITPLENREQYEQKIRELVTKEYLNRFNRVIAEMVQEEVNQVVESIVERFQQELSIGKGNPQLAEIVRTLLSSNSYSKEEWEAGFRFIVERFTRLLFDLLLETRSRSEDRIDKFYNHQNDLRFVTYYFPNQSNLEEILRIKFEKKVSPSSQKVSNTSRKPSFQQKTPLSRGKDENRKGWGLTTPGGKGVGKSWEEVTQEILDEINLDIEILKEILIEGSIPAIAPDLLFVMILDKKLLELADMLEKGELPQEMEGQIAKGVELLKREIGDESAEVEQIRDWVEGLRG